MYLFSQYNDYMIFSTNKNIFLILKRRKSFYISIYILLKQKNSMVLIFILCIIKSFYQIKLKNILVLLKYPSEKLCEVSLNILNKCNNCVISQ